MAHDASLPLVRVARHDAKDKRSPASSPCRPKHARSDRPPMNQSPKLSAVPATSPMRCGSTTNAAILFRSSGALAYPVFRVDCLRYRRGNAGYHGRSRASCRQAVLAGRRNGIRSFYFLLVGARPRARRRASRSRSLAHCHFLAPCHCHSRGT